MAMYKLTYFDFRGRAEPIRQLFVLADVAYQDIRLSQEGFKALKPELPYGQVPILEFDNVVLSQTATIARFLGTKFGFYGTNELEAAKIDEISDAIADYGKDYWAFYGGNVTKEESVKKFLEVSTPKYLTKFSQILTDNGGKFVVGGKLTWADILLFDSIEFYGGLCQVDLVKDYPALQSFYKDFTAIPKIKHWRETRPVTPF